MNCQAIQNKILALPDPRLVPDPLRDHVAGCGACRTWAEQAGRLESLLERLPVPPPPADKKRRLIDDLIHRPAVVEPAPERGTFGDFLRRNATLVGGLAAALLVALGGWWLFTGNGKQPDVAEGMPEDPFLRKIAQRDVEIAKATTAPKRLAGLGGLAGDISAQAGSMARIASEDELRDLARWYDRVVKDGMIKQAEAKLVGATLTPAERLAALDPLADNLGKTAADIEKAANEVSPGAKPALQRIADTARDGETKLRALARK